MKKILLLSVMIIITVSTMAQTYSSALVYRAEGKDVNAQYDLATCYLRGLNIAVDYQKAFYWFKKAAEKGSVYAQLDLGKCYFRAIGTPLNEELAFHWFQKALSGGDKEALTLLGLCYYAGKGVEKNALKAFDYFRQAAEYGSAEGKACLGWCYASSRGDDSVKVEKAMGIWSDAASSSEIRPMVLYLTGMFLLDNIKYGNAKMIYSYFREAANASNPVGDAMLKSALMEECGLGTVKNEANAIVLRTSYKRSNFTNETGTLLTSSKPFMIDRDGEVSEDTTTLINSSLSMGAFCVQGNEEHGAVLKATMLDDTLTSKVDDTKNGIFDIVEQLPTFPLGENGLMLWLNEHIHYPAKAQENSVEGRVIVQFVVARDGSIKDVTIAKSVDPSLDQEAVRVVKLMPKWIPGRQRTKSGKSKAVNCRFTIPVTFSLQ